MRGMSTDAIAIVGADRSPSALNNVDSVVG
jgi:hypothetical protein